MIVILGADNKVLIADPIQSEIAKYDLLGIPQISLVADKSESSPMLQRH